MAFISIRLGRSAISTMLTSSLLVAVALNLANLAVLCNATSENCPRRYTNESAGNDDGNDEYETCNAMIFSQALEDYVLSQSSTKSRTSKDLPYMGMAMGVGVGMGGGMNDGGVSQPLSYHSSAYPPMQQPQRPGGFMITKRIGEASMELEAHRRPPVQVVNPQFRPMTNQMLHHPQQQQIQQQQQQQQPSFLQQLFGLGGGGGGGGGPAMATTTPPPPHQMRPVALQQHTPQLPQQPPFRVSENDLYLLGAIEKLVFRVDYLESRIRRAEQLLYYLAGNNKKEGAGGGAGGGGAGGGVAMPGGPALRDPCPTNFTRISENCYYINSNHQVNWKTANAECKKTGAHLAEFEKAAENEELMAHLLNQPHHRGRDYWLGGLNPGLLWIWSNSAKPVNPNMNLTSIAMKHNATTAADATHTNLIDDGHRNDDDKKQQQQQGASAADHIDSGVLSNAMEISGKGRCLKIAYHPTKHTYVYYGEECTTRNPYICEYEDKTLDNKIKKITRDLKLFAD